MLERRDRGRRARGNKKGIGNRERGLLSEKPTNYYSGLPRQTLQSFQAFVSVVLMRL